MAGRRFQRPKPPISRSTVALCGLFIAVVLARLLVGKTLLATYDPLARQQSILTAFEILHKEQTRPYKLYDNAGLSHLTNASCPLDWEWETDMNQADAVLINILHGASANPLKAYPEQKVGLFSGESGENYAIIWQAKEQGYSFSLDYRIFPHPHGFAEVPEPYYNFREYSDFRRPPKMPKRKDAPMTAFISNCGAKNNRLELLKAFQKAFDVHSYGGCEHNVDLPVTRSEGNRAQIKLEIASNYMFIFAAENSNEPGYVTEKVYEGLEAGTLPVYLGAPDIARHIPHPSAVINVADFDSTEDLIAYLKELIEDESKYLKHFEWKKHPYTADFKHIEWVNSWNTGCKTAMHLAGFNFTSRA